MVPLENIDIKKIINIHKSNIALIFFHGLMNSEKNNEPLGLDSKLSSFCCTHKHVFISMLIQTYSGKVCKPFLKRKTIVSSAIP